MTLVGAGSARRSALCSAALGAAPLLCALACVGPPQPPLDHASYEDVRRVVAALDDVIGEYGLAVAPDGHVGDPVRTRVLDALLADARLFGRRFPADERIALRAVATAAARRDPPEPVVRAASRLRAATLARRGLVLAPPAPPPRARAEQLWQLQCEGCHGHTGVGDGAQGLYLIPEPKNFQDPDIMAGLTPSRAFSRIADGVKATAMPSWGMHSSEERWGLAYLVMGFQYDADQVARGRHLAARASPDLTASWTADRTDPALVAELMAGGVSAEDAAARVAHARAEGAFVPATGRLAELRRALVAALRACERRNYAGAARAVTGARRATIAVLDEVRARDADLAAALEERLARFEAAVRDRTLDEIVARELAATQVAIDRAERALARPAGFGWVRLAVERAGLAAVALGLLLALAGVRTLRWTLAVGLGAGLGLGVVTEAGAAHGLVLISCASLALVAGDRARPASAALAALLGLGLAGVAVPAPPVAAGFALAAGAAVLAGAGALGLGLRSRSPRVTRTVCQGLVELAAIAAAGRAGWEAWASGAMRGGLHAVPRIEALGLYPAAPALMALLAALGMAIAVRTTRRVWNRPRLRTA